MQNVPDTNGVSSRLLGGLTFMGEEIESVIAAIEGGRVPWDEATRFTFDVFHERFTLHDSYWIAVVEDHEADSSAVLAFHWDPCFLPRPVLHQLRNRTQCPYLFIRLGGVSAIEYGGIEEIEEVGLDEGDLAQRTIGASENATVEGKTLLSIEDIYGGNVYITFEGEPEFLALDQDWSILDLEC
ncbi:MAG: hypothetical protein ACYS8Z_07930 [Planctomycetota bacterium]|jgi:hypothetical protein